LNNTAEQGISDIAGCLTDRIIVFPGGWGESLPEWLKTAITLERMIWYMKTVNGEEATGSDAEACAYLMTVSLSQPMDSGWTQIYLYVAAKTCRRWNKTEVPADVAVESISENQTKQLSRLKVWLYHQRISARLDKERSERRRKKEEDQAERKAEQPALFEF
jgi:hypothetical protein